MVTAVFSNNERHFPKVSTDGFSDDTHEICGNSGDPSSCDPSLTESGSDVEVVESKAANKKSRKLVSCDNSGHLYETLPSSCAVGPKGGLLLDVYKVTAENPKSLLFDKNKYFLKLRSIQKEFEDLNQTLKPPPRSRRGQGSHGSGAGHQHHKGNTLQLAEALFKKGSSTHFVGRLTSANTQRLKSSLSATSSNASTISDDSNSVNSKNEKFSSEERDSVNTFATIPAYRKRKVKKRSYDGTLLSH